MSKRGIKLYIDCSRTASHFDSISYKNVIQTIEKNDYDSFLTFLKIFEDGYFIYEYINFFAEKSIKTNNLKVFNYLLTTYDSCYISIYYLLYISLQEDLTSFTECIINIFEIDKEVLNTLLLYGKQEWYFKIKDLVTELEKNDVRYIYKLVEDMDLEFIKILVNDGFIVGDKSIYNIIYSMIKEYEKTSHILISTNILYFLDNWIKITYEDYLKLTTSRLFNNILLIKDHIFLWLKNRGDIFCFKILIFDTKMEDDFVYIDTRRRLLLGSKFYDICKSGYEIPFDQLRKHIDQLKKKYSLNLTFEDFIGLCKFKSAYTTPERIIQLKKILSDEFDLIFEQIENEKATQENIDLIKNKIFSGKNPVKPILIITYGPSGSGKSTILEKVLSEKLNTISSYFAEINVDSIVELIPEYNLYLNELKLEFEHRVISKEEFFQKSDELYLDYIQEIDRIREFLKYQAFSQRLNIIWETTGKTIENVKSLIKEAKQTGYEIIIIYPYVNFQNLKERVDKRSLEIGRYIPENKFLSFYKSSTKNFKYVYKMANQVYILDNTTSPSTYVWSSQNTNEIVNEIPPNTDNPILQEIIK